MALFQRSQISAREFGETVTVPNDPNAKLMYYLSCVCSVLDLHEKVPRRLTQYSNYNRLSQDEITDLLALCILFSPEILNNQVFFEDNSSNGSTNRFLELSSIKRSMLVAENMVIGGENRRVAKVMMCTRGWLRNNYEQPIRMVLSRQLGGYHNSSTRPALAAPPRPYYGTYNPNTTDTSSDCCCTIL